MVELIVALILVIVSEAAGVVDDQFSIVGQCESTCGSVGEELIAESTKNLINDHEKALYSVYSPFPYLQQKKLEKR